LDEDDLCLSGKMGWHNYFGVVDREALRAWVWSLLVNFSTVELVSDEKTVPPLTLLVRTGLKTIFRYNDK
jgi:hypothetical protein